MKLRKIYNLRANEEVVVKDGEVYVKEKFDVSKWVDDLYYECVRNPRYECSYRGRATICYLKDTTKIAVSICAPGDKYNSKKGIAIAYARVRNIPIPAEVLE